MDWIAYSCQHFSREISLASISKLKMETTSNPENFVAIYQSKWCNIPEYGNFHTHRYENHKSHIVLRVIPDCF
jgi:hypothetical protein